MTLLAVSIQLDDAAEITDALDRAEAARQRGAALIEWRVDSLIAQHGAAQHITHLLEDSPLPCILTCRSADEGGEFEGSEGDRLDVLEAVLASSHPPRYLDIEFARYRDLPEVQLRVDRMLESVNGGAEQRTQLILSSHDFTGRPHDLLQRVEAMASEPSCAIVKIAWFARSLRDNLEAFELLRHRHKPMIALCMGQFGLPSRALAPKFGGFVSFCTDEPLMVTAPGQPTLDDMVNLYRFNGIGRNTRVLGVIGYPVAQSRSPLYHNRGFEEIGFDGVYLPLPIPPEYEHFKATVASFLADGQLAFCGASVTIPHKQNLLRFVREVGGRIDPLAERIGAANTLIVDDDGSIECVNTDAPAAIDALCAGMSIQPQQLAAQRIAVLGAGGAARAVVTALADANAEVVLFNRDTDRAHELAASFDKGVSVATETASRRFDIVINATSVGMSGGPAPNGSPLDLLDTGITLGPQMTVFDTVSVPQDTPLILQARAAGAKTIDGMQMFVRQAEAQFRRWTGGEPGPAARATCAS